MNDKINQIRFELRSLLSEEIHEQAIITIEVIPGHLASGGFDEYDPGKAEYETFIQINGFDRAISRGTAGYGGGTPTAGASHGDSPSLEKTEEDVGAWKVIGLPDRTLTGMNAPTPWISFMDWFWDFLKKANLNPQPAKGFGDISKPYSHLTPAQKRQRKYGVPHKPGETEEAADRPERKDISKTRPLSGAEHLWPAGFHIKKFVTIAISSLGTDPSLIVKKFREILSKAKPEPWFRIGEDAGNKDWGIFFVFVNIDSEMPEGWRDRLGAGHVEKAKKHAEWENMLRDFSERRVNVAQLRPLLAKYMVLKEKFKSPFSVDILTPEEFEHAKGILQHLKLEDLIAFAKEIGQVPPVVGTIARGKSPKGIQLDKMWDEIIERLAGWGAADPLMVDVALSNWMVAHGFSDPFDFELLPPDKKIKALHMASRLTFADIGEMMESVKAQIKSLLG